MSISKETVLEKLRTIKGPDFEGDIVSLGLVSEIFIADSNAVREKQPSFWQRTAGRYKHKMIFRRLKANIKRQIRQLF